VANALPAVWPALSSAGGAADAIPAQASAASRQAANMRAITTVIGGMPALLER
jgi:hypothetical protein